MYCMNFCDWAIGLVGSTLVCMRPRLALCLTVMNVVVALSTLTVSYLPLLVAAWAGATLTGRELENGTAQLAWTQSITS